MEKKRSDIIHTIDAFVGRYQRWAMGLGIVFKEIHIETGRSVQIHCLDVWWVEAANDTYSIHSISLTRSCVHLFSGTTIKPETMAQI